MSFNLLTTLKETVTSVALEQEFEDLLYKKQALLEFYPILLTVLCAKPELFEKLYHCLNPQILCVFDQDEQLTQQMLNYLSGEASTEQTNDVLNKSIAPTLSLLISHAGSNDIQVILHTLKKYRVQVIQALPHWAPDLLKYICIYTEPKEMVVYSSYYPYRKFKNNNILHWLMFIVLSLVLLYVLSVVISEQYEPQPQVINLESSHKPL